MDITTLKTFVTLATLGNFTQTAQQHNVVQSTISSRIKELESEVGCQLVFRDKRHVKLTREGAIFLPHAIQLIKLSESALSEVSIINNYSDRLRIGTVQTIYDCHVADSLLNFMKNNSDIAINVVLDHSRNLLNLLYDNLIDVCFSYKEFRHSDYVNIPFRTDEIVLVTGKNNTEYKTGISIQNLRQQPILYSDFIEAADIDWLYRIFSKHPAHLLDIDVSAKLIPFLCQGIGYSFLPKSIITNELRSGDLIEIPLLETEIPTLKSFIVYKNSDSEKSSIKRWLRYI